MLKTAIVICFVAVFARADGTVVDACTCEAYDSHYSPNSTNGCRTFYHSRAPVTLRPVLLNEQKCPDGLLFDLQKCYCNWPSQVTCPQGCPDVDECRDAPCDANAKCVNTVGSFTCECNSGYTGDGFTCARIDCLLAPCVNGLCSESGSGHQCECDPGYTGTRCDEVDYCCAEPSRAVVTETTGPLFDFGYSAGDMAASPADDGWAAVYFLNNTFMFGAPRALLYVWYNGAITVGGQGPMSVPLFPRSSSYPVIAPFWDDSDVRRGGTLWHRQTADLVTIHSLSQGVNAAYGGDFVGTWAFIVTWDRVQPYSSSLGNLENTFQCALVSDGEKTYVNFLYGSVEWTVHNAQVGIDTGDGQSYELPLSRTPGVVNIEDGDNTGVKGKFIFRVSEDRIVPAKACEIPCGGNEVCTSHSEQGDFTCA